MPTNPIKNMRDDALEKFNAARAVYDAAVAQANSAKASLAAAEASYDAFDESFKAVEGTSSKPKKKRSTRTSSGASDDTKKTFQCIFNQFGSEQFGYEDVGNTARHTGIKINMVTMRSNASDYVRQGYLSRPSNGRFAVTDKGRDFFGIAPRRIKPIVRDRTRESGWATGDDATHARSTSMPGLNPDQRTSRDFDDVL